MGEGLRLGRMGLCPSDGDESWCTIIQNGERRVVVVFFHLSFAPELGAQMLLLVEPGWPDG
jgi:hypothetical protein